MATHNDIINRIKRATERTGTTSYDTQISDAIHTALRAFRGRKMWFLHTTGDVTLVSGQSSVTLPTDFSLIETARLLVNGRYWTDKDGFDYLPFNTLQERYRNNLQSGTPRRCAIKDRTLFVDTTADTDYTISLSYFAQDATLPTGDQTGIWYDEGEDAVFTRALAFFKDVDAEYSDTTADYARADRSFANLQTQHNYRGGIV
jgi:hypothetical protein